MEALLAVGLAANILQFTDRASKLACTFSEIRKSSDGRTKDTVECRVYASQVQRDVSKALNIIPEDQDQYFHGFAGGLLAAIEDYLGKLNKIAARDPKSWRQSARASIGAWRKKESLRESASKIEQMSGQVVRHILVVLLPRMDRKLDDLLENHARQETQLDNLLEHDKKQGEQLSEDMRRLLFQVRNSAIDTKASIATPIELWLSEREKIEERLKCLHSLYFPQLQSREDQIRDAHRKTFRWILDDDDANSIHLDQDFDEKSAGNLGPNQVDSGIDGISSMGLGEMKLHDEDADNINPSTEVRHECSKFKKWLHSNDSSRNVFWITGKPGSGKSTLMKFLVHHPDVKKQPWRFPKSDDQHMEVILAHYYFWRHGTPLQRSLIGLVRSLLWQMLRSRLSLVDIAFGSDRRWMSGGRDFQFTFADLREAILRILRSASDQNIRFLIFIDGLDEFDDRDELDTSTSLRDERDLIEFLHIFYRSPTVKLCVSSRPNAAFRQEFGEDVERYFEIHKLTDIDIRQFVEDSLRKELVVSRTVRDPVSLTRYDELVQEIVNEAKGVFIWVHITCRLLLRGITHHDSIADLQAKLRRLPKELEDSYELMLRHSDQVYACRAARILTAMSMSDIMREEMTPLMAEFVWSDRSEQHIIITDNDLTLECLQEQERLAAQRTVTYCNGLIETRTTAPFSPRIHLEYSHRTVGDLLQVKRIRDSLHVQAGVTTKDILLSVLSGIVAIAKSILVFLDKSSSSITKDSAETLTTIAEDYALIFLRIAFNHGEFDHDEDIFNVILQMELILHHDMSAILNWPVDYAVQNGVAERPTLLKDISYSDDTTPLHRFKRHTTSVLGMIVNHAPTAQFLRKRLDRNPELLLPAEGTVPILFSALLRRHDRPIIYKTLLEFGADPNEVFDDMTPWSCFMAHVCAAFFSRSGRGLYGFNHFDTTRHTFTSWYRRVIHCIRACLQHNANPNAACELLASKGNEYRPPDLLPLYKQGDPWALRQQPDPEYRVFSLPARSIIRYVCQDADRQEMEALLPASNELEDAGTIIAKVFEELGVDVGSPSVEGRDAHRILISPILL